MATRALKFLTTKIDQEKVHKWGFPSRLMIELHNRIAKIRIVVEVKEFIR